MIAIRALSKHFNLAGGQVLQAVDRVSLDIGEREILGLVGESGSGKSTLGKTILGLHDKTSGEVLYRGECLPQRYKSADFKKYSTRMQMIFQDPASSLNPRMTMFEIVAETLRIQSNLSAAQIKDKVTVILDKVGLSSAQMSRYPHEFSGGQKQRIGIARALIHHPEFIVCDEPISALDVSVQAQIVNLLKAIKDEMSLTLLFIAHDLSMVRYISDRIAVMYLGVLVEVGPAAEVCQNPRHPYTQMLMASNPRPDPQYEKQRRILPVLGEIAAPVNPGPGCRFAARCSLVMEKCHNSTPALLAVDQQHAAACFLNEH